MLIHNAEKWRLYHVVPFVASEYSDKQKVHSVDFTKLRVLVEINAQWNAPSN